MKEEEERLFNALNILRDAAWASFDRRRSYEWKFAFAIWTSLGAFTGALLTRSPSGAFPLHGRGPVIVLAAFGLLIVGIHIYWTGGISKANDADKKISYVYEKKMCPLVSVNHKDEILPIVQSLLPKMGKLTNFSHLSQVLITILLVLASVCAMWVRTQFGAGQ